MKIGCKHLSSGFLEILSQSCLNLKNAELSNLNCFDEESKNALI
jgi:hypothetical protein